MKKQPEEGEEDSDFEEEENPIDFDEDDGFWSDKLYKQPLPEEKDKYMHDCRG